MKKVFFIIPALTGGGAEKVAERLLRAMRNSPALELTLVLFKRGTTEYAVPNVTVKYIDAQEERTFLGVVFKFVKIIMSLIKIINHESPCTILSFMEYSNIVSLISNWLSGKRNKVIISVHAPPSRQIVEYGLDYREKLTEILMKLLYNTSDSVVAVSENIRRDLVENFKVNRKLIHVISNPIDLHEIVLLSEEQITEEIFRDGYPIILATGRLSREKGFDSLFRAFSLLKGKTAAKLVIIGEGREEQNLKQLSIQLGIDKDVFALGYKNNPYKYMKRSAIFVLPSLYEGFGIVVVEAMACGIPVIATRAYEGIEDIVDDGRTGLLVGVGDEQAMAKAILRLLNDSELRRNLAEEAKKRVGKYSIEKIAKQYSAVLTDTQRG